MDAQAEAPPSGWRRAPFQMTRGLVNPGPLAADRERRELIARIKSPAAGSRQTAVVSRKAASARRRPRRCSTTRSRRYGATGDRAGRQPGRSLTRPSHREEIREEAPRHRDASKQEALPCRAFSYSGDRIRTRDLRITSSPVPPSTSALFLQMSSFCPPVRGHGRAGMAHEGVVFCPALCPVAGPVEGATNAIPRRSRTPPPAGSARGSRTGSTRSLLAAWSQVPGCGVGVGARSRR